MKKAITALTLVVFWLVAGALHAKEWKKVRVAIEPAYPLLVLGTAAAAGGGELR